MLVNIYNYFGTFQFEEERKGIKNIKGLLGEFNKHIGPEKMLLQQ